MKGRYHRGWKETGYWEMVEVSCWQRWVRRKLKDARAIVPQKKRRIPQIPSFWGNQYFWSCGQQAEKGRGSRQSRPKIIWSLSDIMLCICGSVSSSVVVETLVVNCCTFDLSYKGQCDWSYSGRQRSLKESKFLIFLVGYCWVTLAHYNSRTG